MDLQEQLARLEGTVAGLQKRIEQLERLLAEGGVEVDETRGMLEAFRTRVRARREANT